jgi:ATP-binding cassette subfamily C protein CydC
VVVNALQRQIRHAALLLFVGTMIAITALFSTYSVELSGNALFLILPVALLSVNDWLSPTLGNQQQLLKFFNAKHSIRDVSTRTSAVTTLDDKIMKLKVSDFKATKTQMPSVSASFEPNTTSVLLGGSGVGKSRFLQALSGLLPFEGCRELELESGVFTSQALLFDSFYLEQFPYVLSDTLGENLRVVNREASDSLLLEVLDKVGLGHLSNLNEWLGAHGLPLSGGEKKRLGLARAILSHSQVILIDEPFESLDDKNIEKVTEIINELAEQKIIVLATHILPSSLRYQQCISLKTVSSCQHVPVLLETSS